MKDVLKYFPKDLAKKLEETINEEWFRIRRN